MPWTYIVECRDGALYTGSTYDVDRRLWEHNSGLIPRYTSSRRPVKLVFAHETDRIDDAWGLELQIKGWRRSKKFALINGDYEALVELARNPRWWPRRLLRTRRRWSPWRRSSRTIGNLPNRRIRGIVREPQNSVILIRVVSERVRHQPL